GDRTRTCTVSHQNLNLARLPIPPHPHMYKVIIQVFGGKCKLFIINFLSSRAFAGYFPMSVALLNPIFCLLQMKLKKAFAEKYRFSRYSKSFVSGNLIEKHDLSPHIN
ncbi:hypothetical protein, partial [Neglectibacter sp. 59]|uniref:hypothetical protein n=1 Tax=Neglectibacter sp. 59 TaxID=2304573 RepID=UPI001A9B1744